MIRALPFAFALALLATPVQAERLLIERVQAQAGMTLPENGMSKREVQAKFGAPAEQLAPRGGQRAAWPVIERWRYGGFTVYFDRGRVVNAVLNQAAPSETGPAPVQR
jgi:hypothetical protein